MKRCGDFGGVNSRGDPCGRPVTDARCPDHRGVQAEKKEAFLRLFAGHPIIEDVRKKLKIGRTTLWDWRRADPEFDARVREVAEREDLKAEMVEESLFARIVSGNASAAETIFWLVNDSRRRKTGRWKDVKHIEERQISFDATQLTDDELERISRGEDPEEVLGPRLKVL